MDIDSTDQGAVDPPAAVPAGPPWSVDLIADLHAGRYPADVTAALRRRIADDPWAASVLTALDATVDSLSLLPVPRMPERFALRLDTAIAGEHRAAAAARGTTGAGAPPVPGAGTDRGVPLPRQAVNQGFSPVRASGRQIGHQQVGGQAVAGEQHGGAGQSPVQRRPPSGQHPPVPGSFATPPSPGRPPAAGPAATETPGARSTAAGSPAAGSAAADRTPGDWTPGSREPAERPPSGQASFAGPEPVVRSLDAARAKRRRWLGGLAAAAAVVAIGTATAVSLQHPTPSTGQAVTGAAPAPGPGTGAANALELDPGRFGDALKQIEGKRPAGPLRNASTYSSCLSANSIDPSTVIGVTSATFQGRAASAIAVHVDAAHTRIVVVGPDCGIKNAADQLASETVQS